MKNILIFCLFCFLSCKKSNPEPSNQFEAFGSVTAQQNGADWSSFEPYAVNNFSNGEGISLSFPLYDEFDILRESLNFSKIPYIVGTYQLEDANLQEDDGKVGAFFSFDEADLLLASYAVLEADSSSFITLESYDEDSGEVSGTFDVTFILKNHYDTTMSFPDTIRFRDGVFNTKIVF